MGQIDSIYRYPVKGLSPELLPHAALAVGGTIRGDRLYAIENGPSGFDAARPAYFPKQRFLMLMRNERLAALRTAFDETSHVLTVRHEDREAAQGDLRTPEGRAAIERFFAEFCADELRGPPKVLHAPGHSFSDVSKKVVSIINLRQASEPGAEIEKEAALAKAAGLRYVHIPFNGASPDPKVADQFVAAITAKGAEPAFVHCASGNRAAAMWLIKRLAVDKWDVDRATTEAAALGLTNAALRQFAIDYAGHARAVVLSEREEATKVELLLALTVPVQRQFFGWPWSRARHVLADQRAFVETVARISGEPTIL